MTHYTHTTKGTGVLKWSDYFGMWKLEGSMAFRMDGEASPIPQNSDHWYSNASESEIKLHLKNRGWKKS